MIDINHLSGRKLLRFMRESNAIEGEYERGQFTLTRALAEHARDIGKLNPGDEEATAWIAAHVNAPLKEADLLELHRILGAWRNEPWVGRWRDCDVRVGRWIAPKHKDVPILMKRYVSLWPMMDSFSAYNNFEKIHPFEDLNGRVGRCLWLLKALHEGYDFSISFLHKYHYQTLKSLPNA